MTNRQFSAGRQILINLGNRYVVFGPPTGLPRKSKFDPEKFEILPRVHEEYEVAERRIAETVRVTGFDKVEVGSDQRDFDIHFRDESGRSLFVDIKARDGAIRRSDYDRAFALARKAADEGREFETWYFNIDRLSLTVISVPDPDKFSDWEVIDVWEKTEKGLFGRNEILQSIEFWQKSINHLFEFVKSTLQIDSGLDFDSSRHVTMSEELMQQFAVPDRELQILDVIRGADVAASFIPRALWVIGSFGRVDLVTEAGTTILIRSDRSANFSWNVVEKQSRRTVKPLSEDVLRGLVL